MKNSKKIFLITILSVAFIFGMFGSTFAASDTPLIDQANIALQKAEADLETAKKALTPAVQLRDALVKANTDLVIAKTFIALSMTDVTKQNLTNNFANAVNKIYSVFPFITALSPPAPQALIDTAIAAKNAILSASSLGSTFILSNTPTNLSSARTAIDIAIAAINATIAVAPPAPPLAPIQAAIDAAQVAYDKARAAIAPAVAADRVARKTSAGGLQSDAASRLNPAGITDPAKLVGRFIKILLAFIGSISLVLYIVAGFLWMTASGNTEKVTKAKSIMVWTTLGVVVMLASYMLVSFVFSAIPK